MAFNIATETNMIKERCHVEVENQESRNTSPNLHQEVVHCPHCDRSYLILLSDLLEEANRFICKSCTKEFWLRRSDFLAGSGEFSGISSEEYLGAAKEKCPKCGAGISRLDEACSSCGVIGSKYLAMKDSGPYLKINPKLKALWVRVLNHYNDDQIHNEFISECLKENHLRYASSQYKQMKDVIGEDEKVLEALRKIQTLTEIYFEDKAVEAEKKKSSRPSRSISSSLLRWEIGLFGAGIICILSGLASPMARNLIGLGVVLIALPLLMKIFFRR